MKCTCSAMECMCPSPTERRRAAALLGLKRKAEKRAAADQKVATGFTDYLLAMQVGHPSDWPSRFVSLRLDHLQSLLRLIK